MSYFERRRESIDEAKNVDEKLDNAREGIDVDDSDVKALIIAALTTILPIAVALVVGIWLLAAFITGILR